MRGEKSPGGCEDED
jgi:hypothetical protein